MSTAKGIGSIGSTALLVSSMTGPGLSTIPALFQQSGWVAPVFIFIVVAFLSGCSALFVCEALSNIRGNEKFQAKVELTTIAQVYLGTRYHYFFQFMLFLALQSVNVASIIIAAQTFDSMLITIFKGTCGLGVSPGGWFCVNASSASLTGNSPFDSDSYFIFTFGFLLTGVMVIPLGFFSLVENIAVQITSFAVLTAILIQWTVSFAQEGFKPELLPAVGSNSSMVLGIVIFNYSFNTTIPSWVNSLKPDVNIHKCMWVSVIISTIFYLLLGVCGAMAYQMNASSDILAILSATGSTASLVTSYLFPVCALVTSIPVFTIVIRSNLLRGEICSPSWAIFWSNFFPWFVCIALQTKDYVGVIQNWSSLFFQSTVNFILPFVLYFVSRKYVASVEPVTEDADAVVNSPMYPNEKNLSAIPPASPSLAFPSPILQNPDNNDVRMFNPDDNYSISIRRSSVRPSRNSQVENSMIAYSPTNGDKSGLPTIVYSDIADTGSGAYSLIIPYSPNGLKAAPVGQPLQHSSQAVRGSANGLGISAPAASDTNSVKIPIYTSNESNMLAPPVITTSAPGSPRSSTTIANREGALSPTSPNSNANHKLFAPSPRSPEITSVPNSPPARSLQLTRHQSSMLASALSFKSSSLVAPEPNIFEQDQEALPPAMTREEMEHEQNRFIAFKAKPWFNPFYLAIISCTALSSAIVFMIIYDLTMLGLGTNVFG